MTEKTCNSCIHFGACSKWTDFPKQCGVPVCASFAQQSEWISVEDRLPDRPGEYLAYTWKGHILICNCCDHLLDGDLQFDNYNVTHWMPLPQPPEMKGGE